MQFLDAQTMAASATIGQCADALESALRAGLPGETDPPRTSMGLPAGELLSMPSRVTGIPTVKLVTVHHDAQRQDPRVKGVHIVFDPESLAPAVIMDAAALTVMRTTAVTLVALRAIAAPDARSLVVFGAGPQARAHVDAVIAEWPIAEVAIVARRQGSAEALAAQAGGRHPGVRIEAAAVASAAVASADIVVCATTAATPLFEAGDCRADVAVAAIGAHSAANREVPGELVARSFLVVEAREAALREAGDVVLPIRAGLMTEGDIDADLQELVRRSVAVPAGGARVFKSVGMGWEDAVVSVRIARGAT